MRLDAGTVGWASEDWALVTERSVPAPDRFVRRMAIFTRNDDGGYSYVYKQPENPDEEKQCEEAKSGCPVEAIGDNGS